MQRFSSVAGEQGSPDTWRDVRGFSVKFYTTEGNYDLVGNNTPVFFIRDGIKFPDFIHSQKRMPGSGLRNADMQWDFWTLSPESAHQVTYLMGDRGLPKSWREMNGYGSHTYQWINAAGERFWVKYHFRSNQGDHHLDPVNAEAIAGADADYYRRDLYQSIEDGKFPSWDVYVQVMPYEDAKTYRFNPFDLTKVWSHADYPLIKVGTHTLNRNPGNFFAEIEQAAFSPANTVPGIAISPDKMLMARVFSYPDAQRYRVGTNYNEIPVNSPHAAKVHNYSQDGAARHSFKSAQAPVYAPNSFGGPVADADRAHEGGWESDGELVRAAASLHSEDSDFGQAGTLYRDVFDDGAKARLLVTLTGQGKSITVPEIRERFFEYWTNVDGTLGAKLRAAVNG
ncbi:catalase [mine drainage metagenome]|uniref:Catalase n=1 Tax=mine drainage metagenome TaxID=410659 RepID=A0A1J5PYG4_9ZZZZ